ncbi:lysis system i-spanin subunit Rz [Erwinia sp. CGal63]|uniref:lysis system i-spanin subunit Rz n=1 Tax=Erwinia sp. CGal63 TaxID=2919889 RepID=UPI003008BB08
MRANTKLLITLFLLTIAVAAIKTLLFYRDNYLDARQQLRQQQEQVNTLKERLNSIAELDNKYVLQLQQAKENISQLERDVAAGKRRLQFAASDNATASAASVADVAGTGLNDAAQRHYFTLRERIETARIQIAGLQEYIRQQCQP